MTKKNGKGMTMHRTKKPNSFFRPWLKVTQPFWIGLTSGLGVIACVGTTTRPSATPILYPSSYASGLREAPIVELVEKYSHFPPTYSMPSGPLNLLAPDDPLIANARIRGIQWPMVANRGTSRVYPREKGTVSFYHESQLVATGEPYNPRLLTAAHKSLPFGTLVRCTRTDTGQSIVVMINDRGPYIRGRVLDLSKAAARALDTVSDGVVHCLIEVLAYPLIETMGPAGNG